MTGTCAYKLPILATIAVLIAVIPDSVPLAQDCVPDQNKVVQVTSVNDHRTLVLSDGRTVALAGIDSFSVVAVDAARFDRSLVARLRSIVESKFVRLRPASAKPDRYGRQAAFVFSGDQLVQGTVAAEGLALLIPRPGETGPCLAIIGTRELDARLRHIGFWGDKSVAILPSNPAILSPHIGRYAIIEGEVLTVGTRKNRTYLNFGERWSEDFTVEIDKKDRKRFGGSAALEAYAGRTVQIRGILRLKRGPMIQAVMAEQVKIPYTDAARSGTNE